jgi:hypothetical protein
MRLAQVRRLRACFSSLYPAVAAGVLCWRLSSPSRLSRQSVVLTPQRRAAQVAVVERRPPLPLLRALTPSPLLLYPALSSIARRLPLPSSSSCRCIRPRHLWRGLFLFWNSSPRYHQFRVTGRSFGEGTADNSPAYAQRRRAPRRTSPASSRSVQPPKPDDPLPTGSCDPLQQLSIQSSTEFNARIDLAKGSACSDGYDSSALYFLKICIISCA